MDSTQSSDHVSDFSEDDVFTGSTASNYYYDLKNSAENKKSSSNGGSKFWSIVSSVFRIKSFSGKSEPVDKSTIKRSATFAGNLCFITTYSFPSLNLF